MYLYISRNCFHFFKILIFLVNEVKEQKITQNDKIISVVFHASVTIHHMIVICGTLMISQGFFFFFFCFFFYFLKIFFFFFSFFFHFFKILIFQVFSGIKGQNMALNDKKLSVMLHISGTIQQMILKPCIMIFICGTQV